MYLREFGMRAANICTNWTVAGAQANEKKSSRFLLHYTEDLYLCRVYTTAAAATRTNEITEINCVLD